MVEKAIRLDPELGGAHALLAWLVNNTTNDIATAARHHQRAIELDFTAHLQPAVQILYSLGRRDEAVALAEYVVGIDPLNRQAHDNLGISYAQAGRFDDAIRSFRTALRLSPDALSTHHNIGMVLLFQGKGEAALEEFSLEPDEEYRVKGTAIALHAIGQEEESEVALAELIDRWGAQWPSEVAQVYAMTGRIDEAFEWLERQREVGAFNPNNSWLNAYAALRDDPRWLALLERSGLSPAQLDAIEFNVRLPRSDSQALGLRQ
jgi:tetratricopeptide (TPR) repeat protein